jgi:hypothetical protein
VVPFKDAIKKMHDEPNAKHSFFFFLCEKGKDDKPVVLSDKTKVDWDKNTEAQEVLKNAKTQSHATGIMQLTGTTLALKPVKIRMPKVKLGHVMQIFVDHAQLHKYVEAVEVGEPEGETQPEPSSHQPTTAPPQGEPQPLDSLERFEHNWKGMEIAFNKAVNTPHGTTLEQIRALAFARATTDPSKGIQILQTLEGEIIKALKEAVKAKTETPPPVPPTTTAPGPQETSTPSEGQKTEGKPTTAPEQPTTPTPEQMEKLLLDILPANEKENARLIGGTWKRYLEVNPALSNVGPTPQFKYEKGDAHCDKKGDIIIPIQGKDPKDALAAYILECGNVKQQKGFGELKGKFMEQAKTTKPMSNTEFGEKKIAIESEAVMDEFRAFAKLRIGKEEVPYQADRNLADLMVTIAGSLKWENLSRKEREPFESSTLKFFINERKFGGKEFDAFKNNQPELKKWLDDNPELLELCLKSMEESEDSREAIRERTATTRHNRDSQDPTDPKRLTSRETYAFEMIGEQPGSVGNAMVTQLGLNPLTPDAGAFKGSLTAMAKDEALKPAVEAVVMLTNMAMQARLKEGAPNCVQFTEEMEGVARARLAKIKEKASEKFAALIAKFYEMHEKNLLNALNKRDDLKGQVPAFKGNLDALLQKPDDMEKVASQFEQMIERQEAGTKKSLRITWSLLEGLLRALV